MWRCINIVEFKLVLHGMYTQVSNKMHVDTATYWQGHTEFIINWTKRFRARNDRLPWGIHFSMITYTFPQHNIYISKYCPMIKICIILVLFHSRSMSNASSSSQSSLGATRSRILSTASEGKRRTSSGKNSSWIYDNFDLMHLYYYDLQYDTLLQSTALVPTALLLWSSSTVIT